MERIRCPETSVTCHQSTLLEIPEQQRPEKPQIFSNWHILHVFTFIQFVLLRPCHGSHSGFHPWAVSVGFVLNEVAMGQVSVRTVRLPLPISLHHRAILIHPSTKW